MNFPKRHCPLVMAILSITIAARESVSTDPTRNRHDPPFWQVILREYVFKTISSSGYQDDDLHGKLLGADFYDDSSPAAASDEDAVVSTGNVYNTPNGQWFFCQDGCSKCEPCDWQIGHPVVTWTLRRVKHLTSLGSPKWGLRLTVVPHVDESFHIGKHPRQPNDNYVMHQDTTVAETSHKLVSSATRQPASLEKINEPNLRSSNKAKLYSDSNWSNEESHYEHRRHFLEANDHRSLERPPLTYYDVDQDINEDKTAAKSSQDDTIPRLIVGIDQQGNKHLVHLIPVDSIINAPRSNDYAGNYRRSHKRRNAGIIGRRIPEESDEASYEKLIVKILESFDAHRNFIEKFLFADRLESGDHNEGAVSSYSSYAGSPDEKFEKGSLESYRFDDSRPVNQYPSGVGHQNAEQDEQLRRYPVMTREVNKPYGEYQDQNSMIEYGPHGVSAREQQQQQQQNQAERSLPLANVDRKSRNSFGKPTDPTFGHEALSRNQTEPSDIEFSMKRNFLQNSANQALVNLAAKSNETEPRIRKLPEADFDVQTFDSDD